MAEPTSIPEARSHRSPCDPKGQRSPKTSQRAPDAESLDRKAPPKTHANPRASDAAGRTPRTRRDNRPAPHRTGSRTETAPHPTPPGTPAERHRNRGTGSEPVLSQRLDLCHYSTAGPPSFAPDSV